MDYIFTDMAKAFATAKWSIQAVEEKVTAALHEHREAGWDGDGPFFSVVEMAGEDIENPTFCVFTAKKRGDQVYVVDCMTYEDMGEMDVGPFKGKKVMVPAPASSPADVLKLVDSIPGFGDES